MCVCEKEGRKGESRSDKQTSKVWGERRKREKKNDRKRREEKRREEKRREKRREEKISILCCINLHTRTQAL